MDRTNATSRKRPWLAALLAGLLTGFGHLYLRRWRRALGWLAGSFAATTLFVDPAAAEALVNGTVTRETLTGAAPMLVVGGLSVIDAYLLARAQNTAASTAASAAASAAASEPSEPTDDERASCPHCGKDLDPELEFCHWCTRSVEPVDDRDASRER